jgi:uncharacterized membrane protein YebE (DUF533 family)
MAKLNQCPVCQHEHDSLDCCPNCRFDLQEYTFANSRTQRDMVIAHKNLLKIGVTDLNISSQLESDIIAATDKTQSYSLNIINSSSTGDNDALIASRTEAKTIYRALLKMAWSDHKIDSEELQHLAEHANSTALLPEETNIIEKDIIGHTIGEERYRAALLSVRDEQGKVVVSELQKIKSLQNELRLEVIQSEAMEKKILGCLLIEAIIQSNYNQEENAKKEQYTMAVQTAWADQKLHHEEISHLNELASRLKLTKETQRTIEIAVIGCPKEDRAKWQKLEIASLKKDGEEKQQSRQQPQPCGDTRLNFKYKKNLFLIASAVVIVLGLFMALFNKGRSSVKPSDPPHETNNITPKFDDIPVPPSTSNPSTTGQSKINSSDLVDAEEKQHKANFALIKSDAEELTNEHSHRGTSDTKQWLLKRIDHLSLWQKYAQLGQADAQRLYGYYLLEQGRFQEAADWALKSASQNNVPGQVLIGVIYMVGKGVTQSDSEAFKWFKLASKTGFPEAQYYLALMYHEGRGVEKNHTESLSLFEASASQGYLASQMTLAEIYLNGTIEGKKGAENNPEKSFKWIMKAAQQGLPVAQWMVGYFYEIGYGTKKSINESKKWKELAKKQGYVPEAKN